MTKEQKDKKGYWDSELDSLGVRLKRVNELFDKEDLAALAENTKQAHYQDYKTAFSEEELDESDLDYIIYCSSNLFFCTCDRDQSKFFSEPVLSRPDKSHLVRGTLHPSRKSCIQIPEHRILRL